MYKHATCLTLALIALLHLSSSAAARHPRSIWPWSAPELTEEPLISEKHAEILRKQGYGEYLDLSSHPLWKVHKYEGIELKPVTFDTETLKSAAPVAAVGGEQSPQLPRVDERNPVSSFAPVTESESDSDLFGDSSLLSYLLPSFGSGGEEDEQETEKADALANAIRYEEQSHPGFFAKLWSKIWGSKESQLQKEATEQSTADVDEDEAASVKIVLPPTRQRYAEISLIKPTARETHSQIREQPANQASQSAFHAGAVAQQQQQQAVVVQPVNKWYPSQHHSQAYIQSWNPNAAYEVQVVGPSEYPSEHVAMVHAYTADHFQRKISDNQEETPVAEAVDANNHSLRDVSEDSEHANPTTTTTRTTQGSTRVAKSKKKEVKEEENVSPLTESQVQQVADDLESKATSDAQWDSVKQAIVKGLSMHVMPPKLKRKLVTIQKQINDKKAGQESMDELRKLQDSFEEHKQQLGPFYPTFRRMLPPIPTMPQQP